MLVFTRKAGERVCIGQGIVVEVLGIRHGRDGLTQAGKEA